ncbi:unnamed protein product [Durusdinium trenchii]|uniref:Uncharacterized protein n=1 Tax=Durusdinium trenchii TaxID=1381693 RepID=A0ABP0NJW7_9DINO
MSLLPGQAPTKRLRLDESMAPSGYAGGIGRGAKIPMQTRADMGMHTAVPTKRGTDAMFGNAPPGYVPGRGRGATGFIGGVSRDEVDRDDDKADLGDSNYDEFSGYSGSLFSNAEYDEEDKEADVVYDKIDVKMDQRRLKQREKKMREQIKELRAAKPTIQQQFADLKRELATVSNEEWEGIPEAQEHLKVKQRKSSNFTPTPDALLAGMASGRGVSGSATPMGGSATPMGGFGTPMGMRTPMGGVMRPPRSSYSDGLAYTHGPALTHGHEHSNGHAHSHGNAHAHGDGHSYVGHGNSDGAHAHGSNSNGHAYADGHGNAHGDGHPHGCSNTAWRNANARHADTWLRYATHADDAPQRGRLPERVGRSSRDGSRREVGQDHGQCYRPDGLSLRQWRSTWEEKAQKAQSRNIAVDICMWVMDPKGYLTDLNALQANHISQAARVQSDADISDIKKAVLWSKWELLHGNIEVMLTAAICCRDRRSQGARTLLKSVITSNPKHGPGADPPRAFSVGPRLRSSGSGANRGEGAAPITPQQLTGRLKAAETSNHVLFMVEQYENVLNEYHVRAALTRLAQSNGTAALSEDPGFRKLLQRTSELVTTFRSQALATVLWSLARVEYDPGEAFLRSVIDASLPQLQQSKPQDLVNSLWACARFGYQPGPKFLEALVKTCASTLEEFEPMDVANLLWSFARLNFHPGEAFLDAVIARSLKMVESFVLVDIANLLWAFAKLNVSRGEVLRPLLQQAEAQVDSFEPAKLASLLWSCNKLQLDPSLALLRALPFRSNRELTELRPRGLSYVLWVYGLLGHNPGTAFLRRVMEKLSRTVPAFNYCGAQGLSGILWSCARFNYDPGEEQVTALLSSAQRQLPEFTPAQLTRLLWACAKCFGSSMQSECGQTSREETSKYLNDETRLG